MWEIVSQGASLLTHVSLIAEVMKGPDELGQPPTYCPRGGGGNRDGLRFFWGWRREPELFLPVVVLPRRRGDPIPLAGDGGPQRQGNVIR